jgi:hypothetical protein
MYDFADNQIACLSCKPSGEPIKPPAEFQLGENAYLPVSHVGTALPHWVSDDGARVFFDTSASLVPQDINEQTDVYEWERDGSGSCTHNPGCIYLISDGSAPEGSYLIGVSASGDDVFMTTRSALVSEDENETVDVYDARANMVSRPTAPQCTGSGCQGLPSTPPVFATPPSATYNGVGNFVPPASKPPAPGKPLTRAQKLAKALKACRSKSKKKRAGCEAQARKKYGAVKKKKTYPSSKRVHVKQSSKGSK